MLQEILNVAIDALRDKLSLPEESVVYEESGGLDRDDAIVRIMDAEFLCDVRTSVTTATVRRIIDGFHTHFQNKDKPLLLVAKYISPVVVEQLAACGINSLDCAGNCHIEYIKNGGLVFKLVNKGEKNPYASEKPYPLFHDAGLKVIFYLLQDVGNVKKTYREIQAATGLSLGAIKNVFYVLTERHFILNGDKGRFLKNRRSLLDLWIDNYNMFMKPKLLLTRMSFRSGEHKARWSDMQLPEGMCWGGECAAHLIDDYLQPGAFIYILRCLRPIFLNPVLSSLMLKVK